MTSQGLEGVIDKEKDGVNFVTSQHIFYSVNTNMIVSGNKVHLYNNNEYSLMMQLYLGAGLK